MDLGISGRKALVCASSKGLGRACAEALADEGVHVVINGRDEQRLLQTLAEFRKAGRQVTAVAGDVTTDRGRSALLEACPDADILINNNAGPSPKNNARAHLWRKYELSAPPGKDGQARPAMPDR